AARSVGHRTRPGFASAGDGHGARRPACARALRRRRRDPGRRDSGRPRRLLGRGGPHAGAVGSRLRSPGVEVVGRVAPRGEAMTLALPLKGRPSQWARLRTMAGVGTKMMFHDRLKLLGTLFGVVFAVVLGNFQIGTFLSLLQKNRMFVENAREVDIWVTPPGTRQFQGGKPLNDSQLNRARATRGVAWAEPLVLQTAQLQLPNGGSEPVSLVGTRAPRFAGGPW